MPCFFRGLIVYESGGGSFFKRYRVDEDVWDEEVPLGGIPSSDFIVRNPSIVVDSNGNNVGFVYSTVVRQGSQWHYNIGYDIWSALDESALPYGPLEDGFDRSDNTFQMMPVAATTRPGYETEHQSVMVAAWRGTGGMRFGIGGWVSFGPLQYFEWTSVDLISKFPSNPAAFSNNNATHPAIAVDLKPPVKPNYTIYIAWEDMRSGSDGGIRLIRGTHGTGIWPPDANQSEWMSSTIYTIASNTSTETNSNPTIALDATGNLNVAWVYRNSSNGTGEIRVKTLDGNNPNTVVRPQYTVVTRGGSCFDYPGNPSITDYRNAGSDNLSLVWSRPGSNLLECALFNAGTSSWSLPFPLSSSGKAVAVSEYRSDDNTARDVLVLSGSGSPYSLTTAVLPTTPSLPVGPVPYFPPNGQQNVGLQAWVGWCGGGADYYWVEVSKNQAFSQIVDQNSSISGTSYQATHTTDYNTWYYWHVKAHNASGWSDWSATWSFKTYPYTPPGCPYVFAWNGGEYRIDNNILPQVEYPENQRDKTMVTDTYKLLVSPEPDEAWHYRLELREFEQEWSQIDNVRLLAIDHAANTNIAVLPDGKLVEYSPAYHISSVESATCQHDQDRLTAATFQDIEGTAITTSTGDRFTLHFEPVTDAYAFSTTDHHVRGGLLLGGWVIHADGVRPASTGGCPPVCKKAVVGSVGNTVNQSGASFTFRERETIVYVPLEQVTEEITVSFSEQVAFDYAQLVAEVPEQAYTVHDLPLMEAGHSVVGHVTSALTAQDGSVEELFPGESIRLTYQGTPVPDEQDRSFVLATNGRYERITDDKSLTRIPADFRLLQNHPNPFNPTTRFDYELPTDALVKLAVFNTLGEEIAVVVDNEQQSAGYKSVEFDASSLPSGVYYYRLTAIPPNGKPSDGFTDTKRMLLMK